MSSLRGRRRPCHGRARFASAVFAAVSLLTPAVVLIASGNAAHAAQGGSVTPAQPALTNTNVAATSTYTLNFVPSASGTLPNGATITVLAPNGTSFPAVQCNLFGCSGYSISATTGNATITAVTLGSANHSTTNNEVFLTLTLGLLSANLSGTVTVTIQSVANPTVASSSYSIEESTSADPNPVASPPYAINPGPPSKVIATLGTPQTATVGRIFESQLVATVEDAFGNGLSGQSVQFSIGHTAGGASAVFANSSATENDPTNASGNATTSFPQANGNAGGPYPVTASLGALQATFFLSNGTGQVIPGAVQLTRSGTPNQAKAGGITYAIPFQSASPLKSGDTITVTVPAGTVLPANASGYSVTANGSQLPVTGVNLSAAGTQATITPGNTDPIGAQAQFAVTISGVTNPQTAGSYTVIEQTSADDTPAPSPGYAIVPASASHLTLAFGDAQSANPGKPFATPLGVLVTDQFGNPVPGATVSFSVPTSGASATFPGSVNPDADMSDSSGVATSHTLIANSTSGSFQVTATGTGLNSVTFNMTNGPTLTPGGVTVSSTGAASSAKYTLAFTTSTAVPSPGTCPTNCIITLVTPNGTTLPSPSSNYNLAVNNGHLANVGSVFLSQSAGYGSSGVSSTPNQANIQLSSSTIAAGDVVTVTMTGIANPNLASSGYRIEESTTSDSQPVPSPPYAIAPGQPQGLSVASGSPQAQQAGQQFNTPLEVKLVDSFGNPISGSVVNFSAPGSGPTVTFAACPGANQCAVN
ncbi:MAG TPA: Ig-like domain-containing protein, partial [Acidimicrobiales bacterium]|nr:Ig-like domain-containing protein [Acidimicrobiales bacterium]